MPEIQPTLLEHTWPANEGTFQVSGSLCIFSITIPVQGIVSMEKGGKSVSIALLTQLGTSIFEAKLTQDDYTMVTVSPTLKKYPSLEPILIRMARALYLPEPLSAVCTAEGKENMAQLRCEDKKILYSYSLSPKRSDVIQLRRRINAEKETMVYLQKWKEQHGVSYPTRLFYKDGSLGFIGKLTQKPISCPHNMTAEIKNDVD
ncbi:hypothetical protein SP90_10750 [Halodesulfovibrio spirochaetisodalis]|uniref:Uncharacterized protein n=2 Tax=Halodesulfovibrio spirochaetisodalis TaxID=1560234 RepID=A0A1B7XBG8_9BACT|nr:hypothetical protein SP90_10750 [Halodesulfovibrio spirochaetisodalis]